VEPEALWSVRPDLRRVSEAKATDRMGRKPNGGGLYAIGRLLSLILRHNGARPGRTLPTRRLSAGAEVPPGQPTPVTRPASSHWPGSGQHRDGRALEFLVEETEARGHGAPYPVQSALCRRHRHAHTLNKDIVGGCWRCARSSTPSQSLFAAGRLWPLVGYHQIGCNKNLNGHFCGQASESQAATSRPLLRLRKWAS
jgi:hypothetical protein